MDARISWFGVLMRLVAALGVVLLTYNPTGSSFYHWALRDLADISAVKAFGGTLLLVAWIICIRAGLVSLGIIGLGLSALVLGTLVWLLTDYGILNPDRPSLLTSISLIVIGIILGIGLSGRLPRVSRARSKWIESRRKCSVPQLCGSPPILITSAIRIF